MRRLPPVILAAVLPLTVAGCGGSSSASGFDQTTRDFLAYDACKSAVSDQLKAPSTADFQGNTSVDYRTTGGDNIIVTGWVDSENSFGAKLRTNWSCTTNVDKKGTVSDVQAELDGS